MPRYRLTIAYDGTDFKGWQKQHPPDEAPLRTVQQVVEDTAISVMREPLRVHGASRTDSGVHARGQVAMFDAVKELDPERVMRAINARLPDDCLITRAEITRPDFNPISDATSKGYAYTIAHSGVSGAHRPLFDRRYVMWTNYVLDPAAMHAAAQHLIGEHDFASFTRLHHGRESTVRTVFDCTVTDVSERDDAPRVRIDISGSGFLYNMVRIVAGTLLEVGRGVRTPDSIPETLAARERTVAGPTLPPEGLRLEWISYDPADGASRASASSITEAS